MRHAARGGFGEKVGMRVHALAWAVFFFRAAGLDGPVYLLGLDVVDFVGEDVSHFGAGDLVVGRAVRAGGEQAHHLGRGRGRGCETGG